MNDPANQDPPAASRAASGAASRADLAAPDPSPGPAVTEDGFLGHRLTIRQPRLGYRAAIDPLFLAAAVPAGGGERAMDVGAGVGVAALALAYRVAGLSVTGIEIDQSLMGLATDNARRNALDNRTDFMIGDVARPPARLMPGSFDHVIANPPYLEASRAHVSPVAARAAANVEGRAGVAGNQADLDAWLRFAFAMVREGGSVTVIHRADRLDEVINGFKGRGGGVTIFPLWPDRRATPAKRVLVQGRKGSGAPARMARGLVLHEDGGSYTKEADHVLRGGGGLVL
ncbi:MAG: methyltransferase [Alphaproteobacteria bacterium]|nr:methyltransferase [Alphaproteobacteria bacterium]